VHRVICHAFGRKSQHLPHCRKTNLVLLGSKGNRLQTADVSESTAGWLLTGIKAVHLPTKFMVYTSSVSVRTGREAVRARCAAWTVGRQTEAFRNRSHVERPGRPVIGLGSTRIHALALATSVRRLYCWEPLWLMLGTFALLINSVCRPQHSRAEHEARLKKKEELHCLQIDFDIVIARPPVNKSGITSKLASPNRPNCWSVG
jgi:hypothetical protein